MSDPHCRLVPLTPELAEQMAAWRYPGPWSVYDITDRLDPADGFWAVARDAADGTEQVVGFACFGVEARVPGLAERPGVLDVGVGMSPELTGQGLGREFAGVVVEHGAGLPGVHLLRAVVQEWNARSRRLLASLGFLEAGTHQVGELTYVIYERTPTANDSGATSVSE